MISIVRNKLFGLKGDLIFSMFNFGAKLVNNLIIFSILARMIDVEYFGVISFLIMIATIGTTTLEFGHKYIITKEVSTDKTLATEEYVNRKVFLKGMLFCGVFLTTLIYFLTKNFWGVSPMIMIPFIFSGYFVSLANLNFALFSSISKFYLESLALMVNMLVLFLGLAAVYLVGSWEIFLLFVMLGSVVLFIVSMFFLKQQFGISFKKYFKPSNRAALANEFIVALPFAIIIFGDIVFSSLDSFLVEENFSNYELGIYEGIKKIILGLSIFSLIIVTALMPWISRTLKHNILKVKRNLFIAISCTTGGGVLIFLVYYFNNEFIVKLLLGENFMEITTWDSFIGLFVLSKYLRVVPALYLIMGDLDRVRMFIIYLVLIFGGLLLQFHAISYGMKYTFKVVTIENLALSGLYTLAFLYYLGRQRGNVEITGEKLN